MRKIKDVQRRHKGLATMREVSSSGGTSLRVIPDRGSIPFRGPIGYVEGVGHDAVAVWKSKEGQGALFTS
jgi:hypothetical protein